MDRPSDILLRLTSNPKYICVARAAVEAAAQRMGLDKASAGHASLATSEALANVINHGYRGQRGKPIWLTLTDISEDQRPGIQIVVEDEGEQVDLCKIKSRPLEEVRPGGLGVHIIQQLMERVQYEHRPEGKGLRLTMCKFKALGCGSSQETAGVSGGSGGSGGSGESGGR